MFRNPVDICNRALQHCGASRISDTEGFTEDSKNASECAFVYDKLRRAELRRNVWRFAIRHAVIRPINDTFMLLAPALWASSTTYFNGSIVSDALGNVWISSAPGNLGNAPGNSGYWDLYFGPLAIPPWDDSATTAYYAGDVVYVAPGDGTYRVFLSLQGSNSDDPTSVGAWDDETTYSRDALVSYLSTNYQSLIDLNLNNTPSLSPAAFSLATTYASGDKATASNGLTYTSAINGNIGNDPVLDDGTNWTTAGVLTPWTTTITRGVGSTKWLELDVALQELIFLYPLGSGPSTQVASRNVFRLPANYLRVAPQDPKAGSVSYLGAPSGLGYSDWDYEGDFIVTRTPTPIVLRFVADMTDVTKFDDMFCEGLACRIGIEICQPVTQSAAKVNQIASFYQKFMGEARIVNGIETGPTEPAEDDYVTCRL